MDQSDRSLIMISLSDVFKLNSHWMVPLMVPRYIDFTLLLWLMGRIVKGCVREVSLAQVSCILMYVYAAPPTPVGAWSMALGLRQRFEYYCIHMHNYYKHTALQWNSSEPDTIGTA